MNLDFNRTIDIDISFDDIHSEQQHNSVVDNSSSVDMSLQNIDVAVDVIDFESSKYSIQVQFGHIYKGDKGDKGDPGKTPVRGDDYWTESDVNQINNYITDYINMHIGDAVKWNLIG